MSTVRSEEEWDKVYDLKDRISEAVDKLVNEMTKDVPKDVDTDVRVMLTEEYRFWRN